MPSAPRACSQARPAAASKRGAAWGLTIAPAALCLSVRLWRDRLLPSRSPEQRSRTRWTLAYVLLIAAVAHAMPRVASTLWSGAPDYAGADLEKMCHGCSGALPGNRCAPPGAW